MNDRIDAVLVDTSVYHKKQCDFEGITNSIIPMLLQLLRANKKYCENSPDETILVISDDSDWKNTLEGNKQVIVISDLEAAMVLLWEQLDDKAELFQMLLSKMNKEICSEIKNAALCEAFCIDAIDSTAEVEIKGIKVSSIKEDVIPLDVEADCVLLQITATLDVDGYSEFLDEDHSVWDDEERCYYFCAYTNRLPRTPEVITGSNNEDSTLTEGTVHYDVRFDAIAPTSAHDAASQDVIRLIINVEAQTAFNPGYPLTKRAIYYCSRMISAQHGPIFKKSEYGKIRKVYSIWVCTKPSDEFQNTLTRYSIRPEHLIGNTTEKLENYDLMSVVTICLGKSDSENYTGILKFLDVLLSSSRAATEKKKILEEEFGVAMSEELERKVLIMCNLSQGVRAEGRKEGISIGEIGMLVQLVRDGDLKPERAAEKAKMTVEEFKKIMATYPLQTI